MNIMVKLGFGVAVLLSGTASSFAQGATQSPASPNSSNNLPQSPDSVPSGARTLPPGTTGTQQMGTIGTTRVQPEPATPSPGIPSASPEAAKSSAPK
jgi:hypothetical protein